MTSSLLTFSNDVVIATVVWFIIFVPWLPAKSDFQNGFYVLFKAIAKIFDYLSNVDSFVGREK